MTLEVVGQAGLAGWRRFLVLAFCAYACGGLCVAASLVVWSLLPESGLWLDPGNFLVGLIFSIPLSSVGLLFACFMLRDARLGPSVGVVSGCALLASAALVPLGFCGALFALLAGCGAMVFCADRFPERRVLRGRGKGTRPAGGVSDGPR